MTHEQLAVHDLCQGDQVSRWHEPIDRGPGRTPVIQTTEDTVSYEFGILGGVMARGFFTPTKRTRLSIRCDRSGLIVLRILEGRSSSC